MTINFLVRGTETTRVEFDGGAWIDIRSHISIGERDAIAKRARKTRTRQTIDPKTRQANIESVIDFDDAEWVRATLETIVVGWSDEDPVTPETIARLPEQMVQRLWREFNDLNPTEESEAEKNSDSVSPLTTDQGEADSQANSDSWESWPASEKTA